MATAKTKRPTTTTTRANDVDRLASKFGSRLRIADVPSKGAGTRTGKAVRPAQTSKASRTPEENRTAAMKIINNALQTLASSGGSGGSSTHSTALSSASAGRSALNQLRKQDPKAIDTERAALCMVGKIIPLGILGEALRLLEDVRNHLPSLYEHGDDVRSYQKPVSLLLLPLPTSSLEPSLQNCIHTYLSHSFTVVSQAVSTKPDLLDVFCRMLDGQTSLHSWTTFLTDLPRKTLDCLIKRYYITLTNSFTSPAASAPQLLKIRFYALRNLLLATDLDVTAFWEQCLKYATSFARSQGASDDDEKAAVLLKWFTKIEDAAGDRREGKGWIAFCEYWLALAKRAGHMEEVNVIASHIRKAASSSSDASQLVTRTCTTLTQLMVALDQPTADDDLISKVDVAQSELSGLQAIFASGATIDSKLWRIVDKSRRACVEALSRSELRTPQHDSIIRLLMSLIIFFERVIDITGTKAEKADATISALDSLFQLASTALEPNRADTCDQAYDYLIRALHLIERCHSDDPEDKKSIANYLRCLSGAFANLAGSLYKAERHGFAIRFLLQACPLSTRASNCYSECQVGNDTKDSDKDHDMWSTHRSQVYRRWELLGVCYIKTGDRRLAHEAFVQGVVTYPYEDDQAPKMNATDMNKLPPSLLNAVDRLTHLAVSELRLDAEDVSLRKTLQARGVPSSIIGGILSRQAYSLSDRTKPHVRMAVSAILVDILATYDAVRHPIRRAETLVRVLEHTYYDSDKNAFLGSLNPDGVIREGEVLLSDKANAGEDVALTPIRPYYRVVMLFWALLHSHRSGEQPEHITKQVRLVLEALELLVVDHASTGAVKGPNVTRGRTMSGKTTSSARSVSRAGPKATAAASSSRTRTARSNSVRQPRTTPGTTRDAPVNKASSVTPSGKRELHASEVTSVAELALMVAESLNLSGHLLLKLQLLVSVRRLLDRADVAKSEAFFRASSILAHELVGLGKLTLASEILVPLVKEVRETAYPSSSSVLLLLRYAELLALSGDVSESASIYEDACRLAEDLPDEESGKGVSVTSKIRSRATSLERVAIASSVFAIIQDAKNRPAASLEAHLQALRLLNRATETLSRLTVMRKPDTSADPFAMTDVKDALPNASVNDTRSTQPRSQLDGLEWRIANALLETQLALSQAYASRGSVREAEYFGQQAEELARVLGSSAMIAQALLQKVDLQMALGNPDDARASTDEASGLVRGVNNLHEVDVHRANGDRLLLCSEEVGAQSEFEAAVKMLADTEKPFEALDKFIPRGSKVLDGGDIFVPVLRAKILRRQVWLLRDTLGEQYESLLEELFALPQRHYVEVHINSVLGRLALYDINERFRADMALSSLAESTIALPIGMTNEKSTFPAAPQDILEAIQQADEHFVSHLSQLSNQDSATNVRCAAIALALISTYQASMGIAYEDSPAFAARLLDMSCSITLTRELIEAISFKFPNPLDQDDMRWPSESPTTSSRRQVKPKGRALFDTLSDDDEDDNERFLHDGKLRQYWEYVLKKHQSEVFIQSEASAPEIDSLPENWMLVTVSLTEDRTALLLSRQRPKKVPMVFCVPLRSRHDEDDEGHFTFDDAMTELKDIIKLNDEGARGASQIKPDDKEAKVAWWASRKQLDQRMKDLVENIEFCWLGAFKTMLSQPTRIPANAISALRVRLEKVFHRILGSQEKKSKRGKLRLETSLLELFAALPPTCRDEELQDLVYFVLDLYHFHGMSVALAEVDIDLVVIDLRSALEEYHSRNRGKIAPEPDAHTFLVLDKNLQGIPWESLPILRGHSVSRVPSISFITDRLAWARCQRGLPLDPTEGSDEVTEQADRVLVNPSKAYYLLNPSGDLAGTEGRFKAWVKDLKKVGWEGVVGKEPSEQEFLNALARKDLVVYFGHGGAEQYARSHKIRHLQRCAATMLWGCSSGALREMGEFDRIGMPNNYMLAGCPSLVANLWDVTDRDIDKFALSVFTKLRLESGEVGLWQKGKRDFKDGKVSIAAAVAQSRDVCKLKYLTGSAVVVYGIPFYL